MDRTPGQLLSAELKRLNVKKIDLARRIAGPQAAWLLVHRWTQDRGFNEENQHKAEDALGLPRGYFTRPDQAAAKEAYRRKVFEGFCATELGQKASEQELRVLNAIPFLDDILPTPYFYAATLLALQNRLTPTEVAAVIAENSALLESAKSKGRKPTK